MQNQKDDIAAIAAPAEEELAKALPELEKAQKELSKIKKEDL